MYCRVVPIATRRKNKPPCQPIRENEELSSNVSPNSDSLYIYDHNSGNIIVDSLSIDDIRTITITEYPMAYYSNKYVSSPYGLIRINDENMVLELYKLLSENRYLIIPIQ